MTYYTTVATQIGPLVLASDGRHLTAVRMLPGRAEPGWVRDDRAAPFARAKAQLREYFRGRRRAFDLPMALEGTPFQRRVWAALRGIPYGTTRSYADIARRVRNPKAVRAVGLANGRNPVGIIVPCHRVIGADGSLTGYGGGLKRKRALLALEAGAAALAVLAWMGAAWAGPDGPKDEPQKKEQKAPQRPALEMKQGRYFAWAMPSGWAANETTNGVDLTAPDGRTGATSCLLMGAFGEATPQGFLEMQFKALGLADVKMLAVRAQPDVPGLMGMSWKVVEADLSFTYKGTPVRCTAVCGVIQGFGQYSATVTAYQAPEKDWEKARTWLPVVARSVAITNPREVAGQDKVVLPRNNPLDNSALLASWKEKGLSEARISQARREGTMGYERMESPSTGKAYNMPLETYDGKIGGYRNPDKPDEVLAKPDPRK